MGTERPTRDALHSFAFAADGQGYLDLKWPMSFYLREPSGYFQATAVTRRGRRATRKLRRLVNGESKTGPRAGDATGENCTAEARAGEAI